MRIPTSLKILAGSGMVYALFAACGGAGGGGGVLQDGGPWVDALTDPVSEAWAAPPLVVDALCTIAVPDGLATHYFAEAAFPGKTVDELAAVRVVGELSPSHPFRSPSGYTHASPPPSIVFLRSGAVSTECGSEYQGTQDMFLSKVRFILPQ